MMSKNIDLTASAGRAVATDAVTGASYDIKPDTVHLALPSFLEVPVGCVTWPVLDDRHVPVLFPRDQALVDVRDREVVFGELYLFQQRNGAVIWQICKEPERWADKEVPCVWLRPIAGHYRTGEEAEAAIRAGRAHLSDGPLRIECLPDYVLGRVIGKYEGDRL